MKKMLLTTALIAATMLSSAALAAPPDPIPPLECNTVSIVPDETGQVTTVTCVSKDPSLTILRGSPPPWYRNHGNG